jgi:hypothetical protein
MSGSAIAELVRRSGFVFAGTVTSVGQSSLAVLPAQPGLVVVRFDRGFLVNPMLGNLTGRPITVRLAQPAAAGDTLRPRERLVFFTQAWVHADEIAVAELARLPADTKTEQEVARAVAALPELHLSQRIANAVLIVQGTVTGIARASDIGGTGSEHDPLWIRATIEVRTVLKGEVDRPAARGRPAQAVLLFPGSRDVAYRNTPRPQEKLQAIFLLHPAGGALPAGAHVAPDPADIQPASALATIRRLIRAAATPPG